MKHFLIANADCTYAPERLSSISHSVDPDSGWLWQGLCRSEFAGVSGLCGGLLRRSTLQPAHNFAKWSTAAIGAGH